MFAFKAIHGLILNVIMSVLSEARKAEKGLFIVAVRKNSAFIAFPSQPADLVGTINQAAESLQSKGFDIKPWPQMEPFGTHIPDDVRSAIEAADIMVADVTRPNMNVYYEIGFAIGLGKTFAPIVNCSFDSAINSVREIGLFPSIGFKQYENSSQLETIIETVPMSSLLDLYRKEVNFSQPLFLVDTLRKTNFRNAVVSAIKASKSHFRSFDPEENQRISAVQLVSELSSSSGVVLPYLPKHIHDHTRHNLRVAFAAGLAVGLGRLFLLITDQEEDDAPIDYSDDIKVARDQQAISDEVTTFCTAAAIDAQDIPKAVRIVARSALQKLTLGASAAENEFRDLSSYFVETSEYLRAVRGEVNIITGRKGAGKSAIFFQVRDAARRDKKRIVVDLKPESHQLSSFREQILSVSGVGVVEHTVSAFWYFVCLSEILYQIHRGLEQQSKYDSSAFDTMREIEEVLSDYQIFDPGDFTTRLSRLSTLIARQIRNAKGDGEALTVQKVTNIVFGTSISRIRSLIVENTSSHDPITFLFDNIDKGWPANGVEAGDALLVRLLLEALGKVRNDLAKRGRDFFSIVFIRHDVYDLVLDQTSDRGKSGQVSIDWTDREKLSQVIFKRLQSSLDDKKSSLPVLWQQFFPKQVNGQDSLDYLIDHSLMRPRFLIDITEGAIANAINRGHEAVAAADCKDAIAEHSQALVDDFGFEVRDVSGLSSDIFYHLIGCSRAESQSYFIDKFVSGGLSSDQAAEAVNLMLWYGLLGVKDRQGLDRYIYDYSYNKRRLEAEISATTDTDVLVVNPALFVGLSS